MDGTSSFVIGHEQCPRCRDSGKDTSKDNLAVYQDGHEYCFACAYYKPSEPTDKIRNLTVIPEIKPIKGVSLPADATFDLPLNVIERLFSWNLRVPDIKKHKFMWSESEKRLIFPVYGTDGDLIMYQSRSWDIGSKKYLTFGAASDILHIIHPEGSKDNSVIIITEDLISAIRVSSYQPAMPVWGSDIPLKTIRRLSERFKTVGVWLDPDMKQKAVRDVLRISQYVPAFFIDSNLDPKFYTDDRIKEHIDICGYNVFYQDAEYSGKLIRTETT